jgi:hypothetical protein
MQSGQYQNLTQATSSMPQGCTSASGYSVTTGQPCPGNATITTPAD